MTPPWSPSPTPSVDTLSHRSALCDDAYRLVGLSLRPPEGTTRPSGHKVIVLAIASGDASLRRKIEKSNNSLFIIMECWPLKCLLPSLWAELGSLRRWWQGLALATIPCSKDARGVLSGTFPCCLGEFSCVLLDIRVFTIPWSTTGEGRHRSFHVSSSSTIYNEVRETKSRVLFPSL